MFDAGRSGSDIGMFEPHEDRGPDRQQYTLKGVEAQTIRLMRHAAQREGMKIGSWVSVRMREAAERALAGSTESSAEKNAAPSPAINTFPDDIQDMLTVLLQQQADCVERISRLEGELFQLTSGQRTIMATLLSLKS